MKKTLLLCVVLLTGCAVTHQQANSSVNDHLTTISNKATNIVSNLSSAMTYVKDEGVSYVKEAITDANGIKTETVAAKSDNVNQAKADDALQAKYAKEHNSWWAKLGRSLKWWIGGSIGLIILLRLIGIWSTGWTGTIASIIGTGIGVVVTGGISLVNSIFDNIYFRYFAKKETTTNA